MTETHSYESLKKETSEAWRAVMATKEWKRLEENTDARLRSYAKSERLLGNLKIIQSLIEATPERKHFDLVNKKLNEDPEYIAYLQSVMEGQDD